jgi:hypothetical protein
MRKLEVYFSGPRIYNSSVNCTELRENQYMRSILLISLFLTTVFLSISCNDKSATAGAGSPTEAYKKLYNAVKAKNTDEIKSVMSKKTQEFAEMAAQRQNSPVENVYSNGFTATTFSPEMPEVRDERVKDAYGAVEVWNSRNSIWEDLPFVLEDGQWKLAVGESFAGTFKSPGKGRDAREKEAANASHGGLPPNISVNTNTMANMNAAGTPNPAKNRAK